MNNCIIDCCLLILLGIKLINIENKIPSLHSLIILNAKSKWATGHCVLIVRLGKDL